jgi:hypothetical protein
MLLIILGLLSVTGLTVLTAASADVRDPAKEAHEHAPSGPVECILAP